MYIFRYIKCEKNIFALLRRETNNFPSPDLPSSPPLPHEFRETCHSVTFYFMKEDSKRCENIFFAFTRRQNILLNIFFNGIYTWSFGANIFFTTCEEEFIFFTIFEEEFIYFKILPSPPPLDI